MLLKKPISLKEIAEKVKGHIQGDSNVVILGFSRIDASEEATLTFLKDARYLPWVEKTKASAILTTPELAKIIGNKKNLILVDDPYKTFIQLVQTYYNEHHTNEYYERSGIHPTAVIEEGTSIEENVYIGANAYVGREAVIGAYSYIGAGTFIGNKVKIGHHTIINPNVTILHGCEIGNHCIIHSGTVIGSDGFGFHMDEDHFMKVPHCGIVKIGDYVEIGSNVSIDRALLGATIIGNHVKIDNLVQIAHNVEIGEETVIAAQVGIAGSAKIGKRCMIGGQVGIVGHIELADEVKVGAQSGVSKSVKKPGTVLRGTPALELKKQLKMEAILRRLPEIFQNIMEKINK